MSEVIDELTEKELLSETHAVLKHEIKTGILAQIRVLEYIFEKFRKKTDEDILKLLLISYETSVMQYRTIVKEIRHLENDNLDNDLCLT